MLSNPAEGFNFTHVYFAAKVQVISIKKNGV